MTAVLQQQPVHPQYTSLHNREVRPSLLAALPIRVRRKQIVRQIRRGLVRVRSRLSRREITAPAHQRRVLPRRGKHRAIQMNRRQRTDPKLCARCVVVEQPRHPRLTTDLLHLPRTPVRVATQHQTLPIRMTQHHRANTRRAIRPDRAHPRSPKPVPPILHRAPQHPPCDTRYFRQFKRRAVSLAHARTLAPHPPGNDDPAPETVNIHSFTGIIRHAAGLHRYNFRRAIYAPASRRLPT